MGLYKLVHTGLGSVAQLDLDLDLEPPFLN